MYKYIEKCVALNYIQCARDKNIDIYDTTSQLFKRSEAIEQGRLFIVPPQFFRTVPVSDDGDSGTWSNAEEEEPRGDAGTKKSAGGWRGRRRGHRGAG